MIGRQKKNGLCSHVLGGLRNVLEVLSTMSLREEISSIKWKALKRGDHIYPNIGNEILLQLYITAK